MQLYFNLNWKIHAQNNNQFCLTPTNFNTKKNNPIGCGTAPGNLVIFCIVIYATAIQTTDE